MKPPSVRFRCDADERIGLGHASRCTAIAEALSDRAKPFFAVRRGRIGVRWLQDRGYPVYTHPCADPDDYARWLNGLTHDLRTDVLVLDVRDDLPVAALTARGNSGLGLATIDDASERRWLVDEAFYPPLLDRQRLDWTGFSGVVHEGWDWVVLRAEFRSSPARSSSPTPTVLVTMGGTDPAGLTSMAVGALAMVREKFRTRILLGPTGPAELDADLSMLDLGETEIIRDPDSVASVMADSDLAIASFGVTAFELAAMGIPAIHLCLSEDHALSAQALSSEGISVNLGPHSKVSAEGLCAEVTRLLRDSEGRAEMTRRARARIDGRGAERIADRILALGSRDHDRRA
jgi:spore coat polysaccharide biosynthesis protein SpsF